ncbi:Hint domain-containing protein [Acetobacteraceae bacterium KSS8]|uniref:Hint domain-containing protein n=1 Tax=Endosaccharibacter trunci TaxID=2812733 RepID=A0ABT1WB41_9PROT|nr:Hint domain-containing protein [Acetobacteraceae bacterium KSS8]
MPASSFKFVSVTISNELFPDGSVVSGSYLAQYDASGTLVAILNANLAVTSASGQATTFNGYATSSLGSNNGAYTFRATGASSVSSATTTFSRLTLNWNGTNPSVLGASAVETTGGNSSTVTAAPGGTISSVTDTAITSTITGAKFADGSTLTGSWTAVYDGSGNLLAVTNASFTVSGSGGTTTFTAMGTLPYANSASSTSYEIHSLAQTGSSYSALYVDWRSENPSALYEGTPSLYTSVVNSTISTAPIRLASDGTTGVGTVPSISGLTATGNATDQAALTPFAGVTVSDSDTTTSVSATITVTDANGLLTDANGTLSGSGLTKVSNSVGTYTLAATTTTVLTSEIDALKFTPTKGQVADGNTVSTKFSVAINDSDGSVSTQTTLTIQATCFLPGSLIATPSGEAPVETLAAGDTVMVLEDGHLVPRPVRWAGRGRISAEQTAASDAAFPIRIRAGAFGPDQPRRDLLVTPEHCLLTEAGLIPARMLVNGGSVLIDRDVTAYDYFHLELDRHGILMAENLPAESYLDSGNRGFFSETDSVRPGSLRPAAPLAVARNQAEPVWRALALRARDILGLALSEQAAAYLDGQTPEAPADALRLLLADGRELAALSHDGDRRMFRIPRGAQVVKLLSGASVPAERIGPFIDDRRRLGVPVTHLVWWQGLQDRVLPAADLAAEGWHDLEGSHRWTNGDATLVLPPATEDSFLDIHLAA